MAIERAVTSTLILALVALTACTPANNIGATGEAAASPLQAPTATPALIGTVWLLTAYSDGRGGLRPVLPGTRASALFETTGFLIGSAGCNTYSTVFQTVATTLSFIGPIRTSQLVCEQLLMDQEQAYLRALAKTATYQLQGGQLVLVQSTGAPLAEYSR